MGNLRNVAVVLAGGTGTRVGLSIPKQLIKIAGKPIIEHTIAAMQASPVVDEIIVMMAPGYLDEVRAIVADGRLQQGHPDPRGAAAETRNDTTAPALAALGEDECNVLLHDAVRPLVSADHHHRQRRGARDLRGRRHRHPVGRHGHRGRRGEAGSRMTDVLPRHLLRRGQTPQSFRLSTIRAAYAKAAEDPDFTATDDCTVVLRYLPEVPIAVVPGHERNMKVTEPIDVYIADKLFQLTCADHPGRLSDEEYRAALDGKTVVVFGGSYGIGGDIADLARDVRRHGARRSPAPPPTPTSSAAADIAAACREVLAETGRIDFVVNTAGVLPRGALAETTRGDDLRGHRRQLPGADLHRPGVLSRTSRRRRARCCCSRPRPTPAVAPATRSTPRPRPRWST